MSSRYVQRYLQPLVLRFSFLYPKQTVMKKIFFLLLVLLPQICAHASVRTVSNDSELPAEFRTIQDAINACQRGDTVYVHGSAFIYASFTITRTITIIGPGWRPDKISPVRAIVDGGSIVSSQAG